MGSGLCQHRHGHLATQRRRADPGLPQRCTSASRSRRDFPGLRFAGASQVTEPQPPLPAPPFNLGEISCPEGFDSSAGHDDSLNRAELLPVTARYPLPGRGGFSPGRPSISLLPLLQSRLCREAFILIPHAGPTDASVDADIHSFAKPACQQACRSFHRNAQLRPLIPSIRPWNHPLFR